MTYVSDCCVGCHNQTSPAWVCNGCDKMADAIKRDARLASQAADSKAFFEAFEKTPQE